MFLSDFFVSFWQPVTVCLLVFLCCWLVAITPSSLITEDSSLKKRRSIHDKPTSRLGGFVAILISAVWLLLCDINIPISFIASILPLLVIGLFEDLHRSISPTIRILIICFSAFLYLFFDGAVFSGAGFESVDTHWLFVALAPFLTALCLVALINAINFIDGVNGLASGHLILTLSAIGLVTLAENGSERLPLILTLIGALVGLFLINFPFGKIFLGDTGAYVFGMMVGILLIDLEVQNDVVSIWTLLLFVAWPAADLIQTILRRVSSRKKAYNADMMHMHHIILRSLKMRLKTKHAGKSLLNPLTSIIILLVAGLPILVGVGFYSNVYLSFVFCIVFFLSFFGGYVTIVRLATNRNQR